MDVIQIGPYSMQLMITSIADRTNMVRQRSVSTEIGCVKTYPYQYLAAGILLNLRMSLVMLAT